jgi:hypothetical protein
MSTVTIKTIKQSQLYKQVGQSAFGLAKTYFTVGIDATNGRRAKVLKDEALINKFAEGLNEDPKDLANPNSNYWRDWKYIMKGEKITLDDSRIDDALLLEVLKLDDLVANGEEELRVKSKAEFLLIKEADVVATKAKRASHKKDAYAAFGKMSKEDMMNALLVYGINPKDMTSDKIEAELSDKIEDNAPLFLSIVKDKNFDLKVFINDMVQESIISKKGTGYIFDGEMIAHDMESLIGFIKDPQNANILIAWKKSLNGKIKSKKY